MTSNQYTPSNFFIEYKSGIDIVCEQSKDEFHNKLYFSNIISLMEKYLYDLFIHEITTDRTALVKLGNHNKFKSQALKVPFLLQNSVEDFIVNAVKNLVWHRLNDVDVLYKNVLSIHANISHSLLEKLTIRHHIVHRNGFDLAGNEITVSDSDLVECIYDINTFIQDIDKKYQTQN